MKQVSEDISTVEMQDMLMLKPWGKWVSEGKQPGALSRPGWTKEIIYGRREDPKEIIEDLPSEDYGLMLDGCLCGLSKTKRGVILAYYVKNCSQHAISKYRKVSRTRVAEELSNAIHQLYGAVRERAVYLSSTIS